MRICAIPRLADRVVTALCFVGRPERVRPRAFGLPIYNDVGTIAWDAQTQSGKCRCAATHVRERRGSHRADGAGGGTRTPTGLAALRIFLPATAFAASRAPRTAAQRPEFVGWTIPSPCSGRAGG